MNQSAPPSDAVARLPVWATVRQAYAVVLGEPKLLLRALALPFVLSILLSALAFSMPPVPLASFVLAIAGLIPYAIFGVAWCRLTLLGPVAGQPPLFPAWAQRHWRYFGYLVAQAVIVSGLLVPPIIIGALQATNPANAGSVLIMLSLGELAIVLGAVYLAARLSFVFPAAAAGEKYSWRHSWAHTRGQGLRLLGTIALSIVPAVAVLWVIAQVFGIFALPEIDSEAVRQGADPEEVISQYLADNAGLIIAARIAMTGMSYLVLGVAMSAITIAFRVSTGWVPAAAAPLVPPQVPPRGEAR
jgi:hypothetical protein